jgi:hypothetical protein
LSRNHNISLLTVAVKLTNCGRDIGHILVRKGAIHGQHQAAGEHALRIRQANIETQGFVLVNGFAAPLDQGTDAMLLQMRT